MKGNHSIPSHCFLFLFILFPLHSFLFPPKGRLNCPLRPPQTMNRQSSAAMSVHQRLEAATDLSQLSPISDDIVVACLRERFMTDIIYTNVGTSAIVALNPHKYVSSNADSILHKYAAEYRDSSEHKERLPPHIFQLANNAYYHMRRTTQDQAIVFR